MRRLFAVVVPVLTVVACTTADPEVEFDTMISGAVIDAETSLPLAGVRITTMPPTETVETDASGMYTITEGPKLNQLYQVRAEAAGYETGSGSLTTSVQTPNVVDFGLQIIKICTAGDTRCAQGGVEEAIETCAERGNAWAPQACPTNQVCDDESGTPLCAAAFTLTVQSGGPGAGVVVSSPVGIQCGDSCEKSFPDGRMIQLTATPIGLSLFTGWSGDCQGTEPTCTVTMDAARTVQARFEASGYVLTVDLDGPGQGRVDSDPVGIQCGQDCSEAFDVGQVVSLTAVLGASSTFEGWQGDCTGTGACTVTMDANRNVTAVFQTQTYPLTVTRDGTGAGTVTSNPAGIDCGSDCEEDFVENEVVELTAMAANGSDFIGWGGDCSGAGPCMVTMDQAHAVNATFDGIAYPIDVTLLGAGIGTVVSVPGGIDCGADCTEPFAPGTMVTLTATPDPGTTFGGWGGACAAAGVNPDCTVTTDAAVTVDATFNVGTFDLDVTVTGPGLVTSDVGGISCNPTCSVALAPATSVTLTAAPNGGAVFLGWAGACAAQGTNLTCALTMDQAQQASASFTPFYLAPLVADANCVSLFHFDMATPLLDSCGGAPDAVIGGIYAQVASRTFELADAYQAGGADEEGYIDTAKLTTAPGSATVELTARMTGPAFGGRAFGVLYSDRDALDALTEGIRVSVQNDGMLVAETRTAAGGTTTASSAVGAVALNTFVHVAATVSTANGITLFVDGAQVGQNTTPAAWTASSSTAWVGAEREGAGAIYRFNGEVDEVRISNVLRY